MTDHEPLAAYSFASDNYSGAHPEVMAALANANSGQEVAYGEDKYTAHLQDVLSREFGRDVSAFPVFNGTGANVVALQSLLPRWGSVICAATSHINVDEGGAPESVAGIKLLAVDTPDGKLTPGLISSEAWGWGNEHRAQPLVVSITQSTEVGTIYTAQEVREISEYAHSLGMSVHMDGARIANAAAALDAPARTFTSDAGVDILSFGGTKNGLLFGEAVVVLNPEACTGLSFLRKTNMQLASKMRFVSAQFLAILEDELWLRSARQANSMASRMRNKLDEGIAAGTIRGLRFTQPTQANELFAQLDPDIAARLRLRHRFYDWDESKNEVRWVCSFDSTEEDVDVFVSDLIRASEQSTGSLLTD